LVLKLKYYLGLEKSPANIIVTITNAVLNLMSVSQWLWSWVSSG